MKLTKQERARKIKHIIEMLVDLNAMDMEENQAEIMANSTPENENEDALLEMRIEFSDKYLPRDKEETQRRVKADMALSSIITAYERNAFINGYKTAEKRLKKEENA